MVRWLAAVSIGAAALVGSHGAKALDEAAMRDLVAGKLKEHVAQIQGDDTIMSALRKANLERQRYGDSDVGELDMAWRDQTKSGRGSLIDPILASDASEVLRVHQAKSLGTLAEIFVFCAKGLNVAQTNITSDFNQADEPKYQETFLKGPDAVHVESPQFDESANTYVMTGSATITDPDTGEAIGAVTVNVDLARL